MSKKTTREAGYCTHVLLSLVACEGMAKTMRHRMVHDEVVVMDREMHGALMMSRRLLSRLDKQMSGQEVSDLESLLLEFLAELRAQQVTEVAA